MKKLITILLLITSIVSPLVVRAETETVEQQTVTYTAKETEAFAILDILGIFTKDDAAIHSNVTRGEFTQIMLQFAGMSGIEISQYDSQLRFPDILNSEYKTAISVAHEKGYVVGYDDGYFHPDKYITLDEAVIIIDNVLGYNAFEELKFSNYDLYDNVNTGSNGVINYRAMGMLLFNALNSKVISLDRSDYKSYTYGETALYTYHNVKVENGIVRANDVTAIDGITGCSQDYVKIGEKDYYDPNNLVFDYLGYNVKAYYNLNDAALRDDDEVIYVVQGRNNVLTVAAKDILDNTNKRTFYYIENDKEKSFDISPVIKVIENYELSLHYTEEMLKPDNGEVVWIDYDYDGKYDVLRVYNYSDYYVSSVNVNDGIIYDVYGKTNITTEGKRCTIIKDGKEITLADVPVGSVVSAYISTNYARLLVSEELVSGKITAVESSPENLITINGTKYETSSDYESALNDGKATQMSVGISGKAYLNVYGKIVAFERESGDLKYGFLLRYFNYENPETDEEEIRVELVDSSGAKKQYAISEYASIYIGTTSTKVKDMTSLAISEALTNHQLIKYKLNSNNELLRIYVSDGIEKGYVPNLGLDALLMNDDIASGYYYGDSSKHIEGINETPYYDSWICNSSSIIFAVPLDSDGNVINDEVKVYSYDNVTNYNNYAMKVYDATEAKVATAAVIYNGNVFPNNVGGSYNNYKNFVVVKDIYTSVNANDETVTVLEGYYQGKVVRYETTDPTMFAGFEKGAVGQIALLNGKVYDARVFYYNRDVDLNAWYDTEKTYKNTTHTRDVWNATGSAIYTNKRSETLFVHAHVLETGDGYVSVQYKSDDLDTKTLGYNGNTVQAYSTINNPKVYKVTDNRNGISVESSKLSELRSSSDYGIYNGSRVILNVRAGRIDEIFIME